LGSANIARRSARRRTDRRLVAPTCTGLQPVRTAHRNPWFSVRNRGGYYTVEYHLRQVAVLALVGRKAVALVRVKRPVVNDVTLELPAGAVEKGETSVQAAARELHEETGILVPGRRFVPLPPIAISSTRMPMLSHVYRVDLAMSEFRARGPHDDEIEGVVLVPLARLPGMMSSGGIYVSLTLAVLGILLCTTK
jgi:8-oxo-dGTP pyrophosphatase MutT (NUDIX family)